MCQEIIQFIRETFATEGFIPLHEPKFAGNEKKYVMDAIDSTYVSSVGAYVDRFEKMIADISGGNYAVAIVNGTAALHTALKLAGVREGDEVITQPVTFVATANAISYCGAKPVFLDVDRATLGLSPEAISTFLEENSEVGESGACYNCRTKRRIAACVPMHTFGHPCKIDEIVSVCGRYRIPVIEDSAESLGSSFRGRQTGTFGTAGIYSFNGNKTVTCGGGGAIVYQDASQAKRAKHLTTTAKLSHPYEYVHDEIGYNYRLPNLNAALACAQLEQLDGFIGKKRQLAERYAGFFSKIGVTFFLEPKNARSNYWLNAIIFKDRRERDEFLDITNKAGVMTRPIWRLMNKLSIYSKCQTDSLENSKWLEDRVVNIPSSVIF